MKKFIEITRSDVVRMIIYISIFLEILVTGAVYLTPLHPPAEAIIWIIISVGALFMLVQWHAMTFAHRCAECGQEFEVSEPVDLISPQGIGRNRGWKYLKCRPDCKQWSRAAVIRIVRT